MTAPAAPATVHVEPGPDGARGIGLGAQTYGWAVRDEAGELLGFSSVWYETPEQARQAAARLFRPEVLA